MIFGDVKGFSKLREPETPVFLREVMGCLGAVIDRYDHSVLYRNTWGDGIFLVVDGPLAASTLSASTSDVTWGVRARASPRFFRERRII